MCLAILLILAIRSFSVGKIRFFFMGTFPNVVYFQLLKECPNKCQTNFEQLETTLQTKEVLKKKFRFYRRKIRQLSCHYCLYHKIGPQVEWGVILAQVKISAASQFESSLVLHENTAISTRPF